MSDLDLHGRCRRRQVPAHPVQVDRAVRADLVPLRSEPGDGHVGPDAAVGVEHQAVGHRADRLGHLAGDQASAGTRWRRRRLTSIRFSAVMSYIATSVRVTAASAAMVGDQNCAAQSSGSGMCQPVFAVAAHQRVVGGVPVRPLPAVGLQEHPAQLLLARVERRGAQRPGVLHRLQRMQDVVDLDEVLAVLVSDVARGQLVPLEPVDVARMQVERRRVPVDDPFRHRPGHAGGVGDPDRLGRPEPVEAGVRPEQRQVVGGEREDAVEGVRQFQRRRGWAGCGPVSASGNSKSSGVNVSTRRLPAGRPRRPPRKPGRSPPSGIGRWR